MLNKRIFYFLTGVGKIEGREHKKMDETTAPEKDASESCLHTFVLVAAGREEKQAGVLCHIIAEDAGYGSRRNWLGQCSVIIIIHREAFKKVRRRRVQRLKCLSKAGVDCPQKGRSRLITIFL